MQTLFATALRQGYKGGKSKQAGKAAFEDNLGLMMRIWALNDTASIKGTDPVVEYESSTPEYQNHKLWKKLSKLTIEDPVSSILNKGLKPAFESVATAVSSFMSADQSTDEPSIRLIDIIVKKVVVNQGKLEKNDLIDLMIFLGHFLVDKLISEDGDYRDRVNSIIPGFAISISDAFLLS